MIPTNKYENCLRMIETGKYQTPIYQNKEDIWLIYFLKKQNEEMGLNIKDGMERAFSIWSPIYFTRFERITDVDKELARVHFESVYKNVNRVNLSKGYNKITISSGVVDFINSLPTPLWMRQLVLLLYGHTQVTGSDIFEYIPLKDYMQFLDLKNKNRGVTLESVYKKLKSFGMWTIDEVVRVVDDDYVTIKFKFTMPTLQGSVVTYSSMFELIGDMNNLLVNTYKCDKCGTEFKLSNRTQKTICDKCYAEKERKRKLEWWKQSKTVKTSDHC